MSDIVLSTLNAKYIHASFGLRYLLANMGDFKSRTRIKEFEIHQDPIDLAAELISENPKIIGLGVYIWNVSQTLLVASTLKQVAPEITLVLGGPEVSHETTSQPILEWADYVICGEADIEFAALCKTLLCGESPPANKIITPPLPDLNRVRLPYEEYSEADVAHRIIYVEAARGCPFTCEFCLSSLDSPVRQFPLPLLMDHWKILIQRGVRHFKFVDRTFNLNLTNSRTILAFFLEHYVPGLMVHFEMVPDRLPENLREIISRFPPGSLQFEVGIQTFNEEVSIRIRRRQKLDRLEDNLRFLRRETGVHVHADLIIGLPGEDFDSLAAGFDRLIDLGPQEIQVGLLKRLRGTPISRHDQEWGMIYHRHPPYEILHSHTLDFSTLQRLKRFARYWDLVGNSGNFVESTPLIWSQNPSPFRAFLRWSDWLYDQIGRRHGIALNRLFEMLFNFLTEELSMEKPVVSQSLARDFQKPGRRDIPPVLKPWTEGNSPRTVPRGTQHPATRRQARHLENPVANKQ